MTHSPVEAAYLGKETVAQSKPRNIQPEYFVSDRDYEFIQGP